MTAAAQPGPGHTSAVAARGRVAGLFALLALVFALGMIWQGVAFGFLTLVEACAYALFALGLTIQWGYAGLFNAGILGFMALGGYMLVLFSTPPEPAFWNSDLPARLGAAVAVLIASVGAFLLARRSPVARGPISVAVAVIGYVATMSAFTPVASAIEASEARYIGGLGLPVLVGWLAGGALAAAVAWGVGKICLGLRSDYLAIATLGVAEIVRALLKNADWLTNGTLTVQPLPWPTPQEPEMRAIAGALGFETGPGDLIGPILARAGYGLVLVAIIIVVFIALQRAYRSPWGRMVRAIRDNENAAAAMGKDVDARRLQIFILGSALMGLAGAALVGFNRIFDPSAFHPLQHTFLIWVMVILGGAGNNYGAIFGAFLVYLIWKLSGPAALVVAQMIESGVAPALGFETPADLATRALQARVFVIGLAIVLVLRFAPDGVLPQEADRTD